MQKQIPKNLIAITIGIWAITTGHFLDWKEGLAPGLIVVDRVLAQEPQEAQGEVLEKKRAEYSEEEIRHINGETLDEIKGITGIEKKIKEVFGEDGDLAVAVAMAESRMNPNAIGDTHLAKYSFGLFQINQMFHDYSEETLLDPDENIRIAKEISSKGRGFENWTTYREGSYLKYLK